MKLCKLGIHKYKFLRAEIGEEFSMDYQMRYPTRDVYLQCRDCGKLKVKIENFDFTEKELKKKYK